MIYLLIRQDYDSCAHLGYVEGPPDADIEGLFRAYKERYALPTRAPHSAEWRDQEERAMAALCDDDLCSIVPGDEDDEPGWRRYYVSDETFSLPIFGKDHSTEVVRGLCMSSPDQLFPYWLVRDKGFAWADVSEIELS